MNEERRTVLMLGPHREAVSGVSTHVNFLFASRLAREFRLEHFQVGSEGRRENAVGRLLRLLLSPLLLGVRILRSRAALVHINTSLNRAFWRDLAYLAVARLCGARVVYQVHGGALPQAFCRGSPLFALFLRAVLQAPDAVVVLARSELEAYRRFVPSQRVMVLPNAIDGAPYAVLARTPGEHPAPLRLLYVGRLAREKGLHEALHGLVLARAQGVRASFVLAGSGPDEQELRTLVDRLMLGKEVSFAGPVFGEAKLALLAAADILLLPTYAEGLPYSLLESMAAGTPPITTRVGAIPDVMIDGVHGLFVPVRDAQAICRAIVKLAANRDLLIRMSQACRKRIAARYDVERLASDFIRLYSGLCGPMHLPATLPDADVLPEQAGAQHAFAGKLGSGDRARRISGLR